MSTQATTPPPAGRLARKARVFILALLLAGLIGPLGLLYAGYQAYRAKTEVNTYFQAASLYRLRTEAIHRLYDMETAFHRFLLDENSANLTLMQRDREAIDQLAHRDPAANEDKLLRDVAAKAQQWQTQLAQPLIDQRKALPSGQGISEEFLAHYRAAGSDLGASNFEMEAEKDYNAALQGLADAQRRMSIWVSLAYLAAAVGAVFLAFFLASGALRHVADLKTAIGN
jgi:hypothetical protein